MKIFCPVIDNGMGLSRTSWAVCLAAACLGPLGKHETILQAISYPYPQGSMNIASNDFLRSDAEEMLLIDTDIVFRPQHIEYLLEHSEPLVFGLYPKKQPGLTFPMELLGEGNPFSNTPFNVPPLVEVKRVARGFMRMHRSVLEKMAPNAPEFFDEQTGLTFREFWTTLPGGHSEDFNFCDRWRALGGRILVDQRITTQHEGTAVYPLPGTF